jgi:histidinol dehydrogenase
MSKVWLRDIDWSALTEAERREAVARPAVRDGDDVRETAGALIREVRRDGDAALLRLALELDGVRLASLRVSAEETAAATRAIGPDARAAIASAVANVTRFHEAQVTPAIRVETAAGVVCERVTRPLRAVGLYVPAGNAPLPSTAIMLGVPARLAGCPVRVLCTPPRKDGLADPAVLAAASACGVTEIFKAGGAQAIAAMAYGTATIPKVDKIFGPGNAWVTAAKQLVAMDPAGAALDMPAGPSEVMVVADSMADPRFVALDLLSQAEHGEDSQAVLVSTDGRFIEAVQREIGRALPALTRRAIIERALRHSLAVRVDSASATVDVIELYAPEHLILQVRDPRGWLDRIRSAGSVFLGPWAPEAIGDYCSGANHVLPTYGYARTYSGLATADFERRMTIQELSAAGLRGLATTAITLAGLEGLDAHAAAVRVRLETPGRKAA